MAYLAPDGPSDGQGGFESEGCNLKDFDDSWRCEGAGWALECA